MTEKEHVAGKTEGAALPTILLVATEPAMLKMLTMALKVKYVCEVLPFSNVRSALEAAKRARSDLIVIHSPLPDLNALELAAYLHRLEGRAGVPVILTLAHVSLHSESQEPDLIVLRQPFALEDLYAAMHTCLSRIL